MMQRSARSTRDKKKQIRFIVNGAKRSTFPAIATESTYLICLGHFEKLLTLVEREKSTISVLLRETIGYLGTLVERNHWKKISVIGANTVGSFVTRSIVPWSIAVPPDGKKLAYEFLRVSASHSVFNKREVSWISLASLHRNLETTLSRKSFHSGGANT